MLYHRSNPVAVCFVLFLLAGAACAFPAAAGAEASPNPEYDPGVIPNAAVATSDNCNRISEIEEEFEGKLTALDLQRIQGPEQRPPLGVSGKFRLAVANFGDPFALVTTALDAEVSNATEGPSPLKRGALGFGQRFGMAMAGTATSEFFSTFIIASTFHQDPHYYRSPDASTATRFRRALQYVLVTRSDSGHPMFNFAEVLGTTASSTLEGTFHPEWEKGFRATAGRVVISVGSDAAWNLMTEFLPDIAKHLNPRMLLLRRLADKAAAQN